MAITSVRVLILFVFIFSTFSIFSCVDLNKFEEQENLSLADEEAFRSYPDLRPLWEGKHREGTAWTIHMLRELEKTDAKFLDTVPTDASLFCPRYAILTREQRKYFWAYFVSAMVRFESNFKPDSSYEEGFNDSTGNPVVSRGLLQISFESSKSYDCGFSSASQIHNSKMNLSCGLKILGKWIPADKSFAGNLNNNWRGGARYWSVLRAADKESYNSIVAWSSQLAFCRR